MAVLDIIIGRSGEMLLKTAILKAQPNNTILPIEITIMAEILEMDLNMKSI
ncbi:MAG: hypothetical protein HZA00_02885 [Nitrospinae bacterium]|nr:hypothetical protein [Nitrospinota bacterium]